MVIEVRSNRMPGGGLVITFSDVTPSFEAAEALERANATLEKRVRDRTEELTRLNSELALAKSTAEDANISKTRFLAAASHDILQPLNAARLYVTSLVERQNGGEDSRLVENIDDSLEAIEEILGALLDISRLDAGAMTPSITSFKMGDLMRSLEIEFAPIARAKGLKLTFVPCSLPVESDRLMLRRLLQNLISNAIKYTPRGRVLVGCRRRGQSAADRRLRHRRRHSRSQARRDLQGIPPARAGRADRARPWPRAVDRRAPGARAQPRHRARRQRQRRLGVFGDGADREGDQLHRGRHHARPRSPGRR